MADRAKKRPMEESLEVVPTRPRFRAMLRWDREGSSVVPPSERRSSLPVISDDDNREADDVLMLVEQLNMVTSTLCEESQEADLLLGFSLIWNRIFSLPIFVGRGIAALHRDTAARGRCTAVGYAG